MNTLSTLNDPNLPLMRFGSDVFTPNRLSRSVYVQGGSGSGKTSGSMRTLAKTLIAKGYGGLYVCPKNEDYDIVMEYIREAGREADVILIDETGQHTLNFLDYSRRFVPEGASAAVFLNAQINKGREIESTTNANYTEAFWVNESERGVSLAIILLEKSGEQLSIYHVYLIITSCPTQVEQLEDDAFLERSYCIHCLDRAMQEHKQEGELLLAMQYFYQEIPSMDFKTWSNVKATIMGLLFNQMTGLQAKLLDGVESTFSMEQAYTEQKIILINLPRSRHQIAGVRITGLLIDAYMMAMLHRNVKKDTGNYTFLLIDEFQLFLNEYYWVFQSISRSARCICIYATQSFSSCIAKIGGDHARDMMQSLLGNLNLKIFHASSESASMELSADTIGKYYDVRMSVNSSENQNHNGSSASEELRHFVTPHEFSRLKNGTERNDYQVEAYITESGTVFDNNKTYKKISFDQRF